MSTSLASQCAAVGEGWPSSVINSDIYWHNLIIPGDDMERVTWRSKQALDFSFLMMYAKDRGTFYVQLEDDVLTKKGYITTMKKFALSRIAEKKPWFVIDFCQLGFIGKMFKSVELPWLVNFFLMFYNDKPGEKMEFQA